MTDDPHDLAMTRFNDEACPAASLTILDIIEEHATDPPLIIATLLDAMRPAAHRGSRIVELGIGTGWLLEHMQREFVGARIYGFDLVPAFVRAAADVSSGAVRGVVGDMERLPLRHGTFDAITTNWTLYFMRDLDAALAGMRACLKPGGLFVAATNAPDHMYEYAELAAVALRDACGLAPPPDTAEAFDLATGLEPMRRAFASVEMREFRGTLTVPDVETALVLWHTYGPWGLVADDDAAARARFASLVGERLREGPFVVTRHGGAFVAMV